MVEGPEEDCKLFDKDEAKVYGEENGKRKEKIDVANLQPPDGGWAWVIAAATCGVMAMLAMPLGVFGIFYSDVLMKSDVSTTTVAWIFNLQQAVWNFVPIFSGPISTMFGYRKTACFGCLISGTAVILSGFATKPFHLFLTYSLMLGTGMGFASPPCCFIIPQYFEKYRARATGFMMAFINVSYFFTPILVNKLKVEYGYQGTIHIVGAIMLNGCVAASLLHPIEWHAKPKEEEKQDKDIPYLLSKKDLSEVNDCSQRSLKKKEKTWGIISDKDLKVPEIDKLRRHSGKRFQFFRRSSLPDCSGMNETAKFSPKMHQSICSLRNPTETISLTCSLAGERQKDNTKLIPPNSSFLACSANSFSSISEIPIKYSELKSCGAKTNNFNESTSEKFSNKDATRISQFIEILKAVFVNLTLIKSHRVKIIVCSCAMLVISNINSMMMIPFVMVQNGHPLESVSWVLSLYAIGGISSRLGVSTLVDILSFSTKHYYMFGSLLLSLSILALTLVNDILWFGIAAFCFGFGMGTAVVQITLISIEFVGMKLFPQTFSLMTLTVSFSLLVNGPLVGLLRDVSDSYNITLRVLSIVAFLSFLSYFLMPWAQRSDKARGIAQIEGKCDDLESCNK